MEADEIARRIRHIHAIETSMDASGEGRSPLTDALRNAIPYMRPEEIRETLLRTLDKLDELYGDRSACEEVLRKEREAHGLEVSNLRAEMVAKERILAEKERILVAKEARIAALERELAESKAAVVDASHKVSSMNQEKFQGTSKKGIDRKHTTVKGRDDDKGDFDGTPGSASPQEADCGQKAEGVDAITRSKSDIGKAHGATRGKYSLADATEKIIYECDDTLVPEGAVVVGHSDEVVFDEEHIIRAYIYRMVTYRIKVPFINGDGQEDWRVEEHTMHMRRAGSQPTVSKRAADDAAPKAAEVCGNQDYAEGIKEDIIIYENGHMPGQVTGTKVSARMLAHLILQHFEAHVPINRLTHLYEEFDLGIGRSTVGGWVWKAADLMEKAYGKLLDRILADGSVCYCDETWDRLHMKDVTRKVYTWIIGNRKAKAVA